MCVVEDCDEPCHVNDFCKEHYDEWRIKWKTAVIKAE